VNSVASSPYKITTHVPFQLVKGAIDLSCDPTYGYDDHLNYTIQDQMSVNVPSAVPLNEQWESEVVADYNGTTWRRGAAGSSTTSANAPAAFYDNIQGESAGYVPTAVCAPGNSATKVDHWSQYWYIGSITNGSGALVQEDILQKYIDHAAHNNILTGKSLP
jgi:hypothetical protein